MRRAVAAGIMALMVGGTAVAHETKVGSLTIEHAWARPAAKGNAAAYMVIMNAGAADRLTGVSTEVAATAELHSSTIDAQGVGRMVPVQAVELPSDAEAKLAPGGLHIMLIGLKQPLVEGQEFPLTLDFEQAGAVTVEVAIEKSPSHGGEAGMEHQHGTN
ncbi:MAG: copper chaperone PCu(A)C [Geminicoccaceae bacterium]